MRTHAPLLLVLAASLVPGAAAANQPSVDAGAPSADAQAESGARATAAPSVNGRTRAAGGPSPNGGARSDGAPSLDHPARADDASSVEVGAPSAGAPAGGGAAATGSPRDDVRDQVLSYLGAIDRPVSPASWRALGPAAGPVLAEVAASPDELPTRRARALEGLAALGGARAEEAHLRLARAGEAPIIVRSSAVRGLGRLLPPARLAGEVRPLLGDASPRVREVAGEVLARRAPAEACADVRAQAARERVAARWARALSACERSAPAAGVPPRAR